MNVGTSANLGRGLHLIAYLILNVFVSKSPMRMIFRRISRNLNNIISFWNAIGVQSIDIAIQNMGKLDLKL
jgi:hypothetical protein